MRVFFSNSPVAFWFGIISACLGLHTGVVHAQQSGQQVFQRECAACHSLEAGQNRIGPSLNGVVGREAGSLESFGNYSEALKQSDVVWTAETLDPWIEAPREFIPDNRMAYRGLKDEERRQQLIEFLQQESGGGE